MFSTLEIQLPDHIKLSAQDSSLSEQTTLEKKKKNTMTDKLKE